MTSALFSEIAFILEEFMRSTLKVDTIRLQLFLLTPRVPENVTQSRPHAADKFSSCTPIAERNLLARAPSFENFRLFQNQQTRKAVVERANEKTHEELCRLCEIADYEEILDVREFLQARLARNRAGLLSAPLRRSWQAN